MVTSVTDAAICGYVGREDDVAQCICVGLSRGAGINMALSQDRCRLFKKNFEVS
jgi:hypothetical protein